MADTLLPAPALRTLRYLLDKARVRFGQTDPRLENQIVPELTDRLREICAEYPYWFLRVIPGRLGFPVDELTPAGWLQRGWYLMGTGPLESEVLLKSTVDQTEGIGLFFNTEARKMGFVNVYDLNGGLLGNLEVTTSEKYWSTSWQQQPTSGEVGGIPRVCTMTTRLQDNGWPCSTLLFSPFCDQKYVLALSWDLALPPWFQYGNGITNLLLIYYPRLIENLIYCQYAEFFKEWELKDKFEREIWGDARGRVAASIPNWGIVGQMKLDTQNRAAQDTQELEWHYSARDAISRNGTFNRNPYDTYYYGPAPY